MQPTLYGTGVPGVCPGRGAARVPRVHQQPGVLHLLVPGRLQLRHHEEDQRLEPQHRGAGLHGPTFCR